MCHHHAALQRQVPRATALVRLATEQTLGAGNFEQTRELFRALADSGAAILLDFSATMAIDGAFLGLIAAMLRQTARRSRPVHLVVCGAGDQVLNLLRISGLSKHLRMSPSVAALVRPLDQERQRDPHSFT